MIVGHHCKISSKAEIGENVVIGDNNVIHDDVFIDENVVIGSNNIIGQPPILSGRDEKEFRRLIIKKDVCFEHFNVIERGTVKDAVVDEGSSIGFFCYISHDAVIGKRCILFPHCMLCGNVTLKDYVSVDSHVKIFNKVVVGEYSRLFHGANVFKSCVAGSFIVGEYGDTLKKWTRKEAFLNKQIRR